MKNARKITLFAMIPLVASCNYWQFAHDEKIDGPYRLQAVDTDKEMQVNYEDTDSALERIPAAVFEVGFDSNYIVAGGHPYDDTADNINMKISNYYYIIRSLDDRTKLPASSVRGPFDSKGYALERQRLNLPEFSSVIDKLQ